VPLSGVGTSPVALYMVASSGCNTDGLFRSQFAPLIGLPLTSFAGSGEAGVRDKDSAPLG